MSFEVTCISGNALLLINFLVKWITYRTETLGSNTTGIFVYLNAIHFENNKFPKILIHYNMLIWESFSKGVEDLEMRTEFEFSLLNNT